jgi:radical SAM enzyme (TIGR01210 family)
VSVWKEKESLDGRTVDAGVVILRTSGCVHSKDGGCTMCGYNLESSEEVTAEDIVAQFRAASRSLEGVQFLKVYTSGSFLDGREMPEEARREVLNWCHEGGQRLLFESRTEFVTEENLGAALQAHDDIEVAIGLESANDRVLKYAVNKNMTVADYDRAATNVKSAGARLRSYILLKPPYLTEAEAIEDAVSTAKHAALKSDTISLNPVNIQKNPRGTPVEELGVQGSVALERDRGPERMCGAGPEGRVRPDGRRTREGGAQLRRMRRGGAIGDPRVLAHPVAQEDTGVGVRVP